MNKLDHFHLITTKQKQMCNFKPILKWDGKFFFLKAISVTLFPSIMLRVQQILFLPLLWLVENIGIQLKLLLIIDMMSTSTYSTTKRNIGGEKIHIDLTTLLWTKLLMKPNLIYTLESTNALTVTSRC